MGPDELVLAVVLMCAVGAIYSGVAGLIANNDPFASASYVNLHVGMGCSLVALLLVISAVYSGYEFGAVYVVPILFGVAGVGYLLAAGCQKIAETRQSRSQFGG